MKNKIRFMVEISIFSACGIVLDLVAGFMPKIFPNGGSISIAMVPIFLMGYRHGLKGGLLTGLVIGTVQLAYSAYFLNFIQVMLDYVLAYTVIGVSAILWHNIENRQPFIRNLFVVLGILIGVGLRLILATMSGYFFWETELIPSFTYNLLYLLPSCVLCIIVVIVLINALPKRIRSVEKENKIETDESTEY